MLRQYILVSICYKTNVFVDNINGFTENDKKYTLYYIFKDKSINDKVYKIDI